MKKLLFLTFNYPYGRFNPSDQCTVRIMEDLALSGKYEVHCVSYRGEKKNYKSIEGVRMKLLPFREKVHNYPKWLIRLILILKMPIYPRTSLTVHKKFCHECKAIVTKENYDLVIAQCYPMSSALTGVWLKQRGYITHLMILFWDSIYGKIPRRVIPEGFALRRQRELEDKIAYYTDLLVSLYPLKSFHDEYSDIPNAQGKRVYLGIPSIKKPSVPKETMYNRVIQEDKINMLYSGTIFRSEYVSYLVNLLNASSVAERVNLIFFSRGVSDNEFQRLQKTFKGTIQFSGWIPLDDLLSLYPKVDVFVSFPGNPTAIRSKVFEYMSFGKPLMLLFDADNDVNVTTFSRYPAFIALDERKDTLDNLESIEHFIMQNTNNNVSFEEVEKLFPLDTVSSYVKMIDKLLL